jgi:hypothetical protein
VGAGNRAIRTTRSPSCNATASTWPASPPTATTSAASRAASGFGPLAVRANRTHIHKFASGNCNRKSQSSPVASRAFDPDRGAHQRDPLLLSVGRHLPGVRQPLPGPARGRAGEGFRAVDERPGQVRQAAVADPGAVTQQGKGTAGQNPRSPSVTRATADSPTASSACASASATSAAVSRPARHRPQMDGHGDLPADSRHVAPPAVATVTARSGT